MTTYKPPRLLVIGHAGHGKDTVCAMLQASHGYSFVSSSRAAMIAAVWPTLMDYYADPDKCFADRHNWRELWFQLIRRYTFNDPTRLARKIYASGDIYCGLRSIAEYQAIQGRGLFDVCIWVDALERLPPESPASMELAAQDAHLTITNNETLADLARRVDVLAEHLKDHRTIYL